MSFDVVRDFENEIAKFYGIKFEDLVVWMVKDASNNR